MNDTYEERIDIWDNAKALLIVLVVLGHALFDLLKVSCIYRTVYLYIYLFHMPLFMFISGLFSRNTIRSGRRLREKVAGYLILGFLLKFMILALRLCFGIYQEKGFSLFAENSVPWYLLVLAGYLLLTCALRGVSGRLLLVIAILFGCLCGYDPQIGAFLSLSRFFVYYPFFLLGTLMTPETKLLKKAGAVHKIISAVFLAAVFVFVIRNISVLFPYIDLIKGGVSYPALAAEIGEDLVPFCGFFRLLYYLTAAAASAAVMILIPRGSMPFTYIGRSTLPIYLFHRLFQLLILYLDHYNRILSKGNTKIRILYLLAVPVIVLILSLPVFKRAEYRFWHRINGEETGG